MGKNYPKDIHKEFRGISGKVDTALEVNGAYLTPQQTGLTLPVCPLWK